MKQFYTKPDFVIKELLEQNVLAASDGVQENHGSINELIDGENSIWS